MRIYHDHSRNLRPSRQEFAIALWCAAVHRVRIPPLHSRRILLPMRASGLPLRKRSQRARILHRHRGGQFHRVQPLPTHLERLILTQ